MSLEEEATSFNNDLNKQYPQLHHQSISDYIYKVSKSRPIITSTKIPLSNIDDIYQWKCNNNVKNIFTENKTDSYCELSPVRRLKTGNMVLELIAYLDVNLINDKIPIERAIYVGTENHQKVLEITESILKEENKGKLGYAFGNKSIMPHSILSYMFYNNKNNVNKDICYHYLFKGEMLRKYLMENFKTNNLIITLSERNGYKWKTISSLIPVKNIISNKEITIVLKG